MLGGSYFSTSFQYINPEFWAFNASSNSWAKYFSKNESSYTVVKEFHPDNFPGGRVSAVTWVDPKGYLWLFGGETGLITVNADLWVFSPYLKMWAIVSPNVTLSGCTIQPRKRATSWSFGHNHYFFGGLDPNSAGFYYQDLWKFSADISLIACPLYAETVGEQCLLCSNGKFWNGTACAFCPDGTVGNAPGGINSTQCTSCPGGQYRIGTMSSCQSCPLGTEPSPDQSQCTVCPAGTYRNALLTSCELCSVGFQPSFPVASECLRCPPEFFKNDSMLSCEACPLDFRSSLDRDFCIPAKTNCPVYPTIFPPGGFCTNGTWTFNSTLNVGQNVTVRSPIIIQGNFSISSKSVTLTLLLSPTGSSPLITVDGCVSIQGSISISVPDSIQLSTLSSTSFFLISYADGFCGTATGTRFDQLEVDLGCRRASASLSYESTNLFLILGPVDSSGCEAPTLAQSQQGLSPAAVAGIAVGCAVAVVAAVVIVVWINRARFIPAHKAAKDLGNIQGKLHKGL